VSAWMLHTHTHTHTHLDVDVINIVVDLKGIEGIDQRRHLRCHRRRFICLRNIQPTVRRFAFCVQSKVQRLGFRFRVSGLALRG
jgi:hypothetical protein